MLKEKVPDSLATLLMLDKVPNKLLNPIFCEKILKFKVNYFLYIIVTFVIVFLLSFFTSKILKVLYNLLTGINRQFYKKIELK